MRGNLLADMATAPLQWFISYVFTIRPPQSTINVYKNNTRNTQTRSSLSNTNNWIREERETNSVSVIFSHNDLEYFQIYFHVHVALPLKPGWGSCKSHFTHYLHFFLLLRQANAHPPCCCWKYNKQFKIWAVPLSGPTIQTSTCWCDRDRETVTQFIPWNKRV